MREARRRRGWTLDEAVEKSGVDKASMSRIERGIQWPSATALKRILAIYPEMQIREILFPFGMDENAA